MATVQSNSTKWVPTYCYNCVAGPDLMTVKVEDGVATQVRPNFAADGIHPACGRVCVKAYGLVQKTYNPHRILTPMRHEQARFDVRKLGVTQKCTFCVDTVDAGLAKGLASGVDPDATPACVNACIGRAMAFDDLDDPDSNVSRLLRENKHFRMHEDIGTGPGFYYLWDKEELPL